MFHNQLKEHKGALILLQISVKLTYRIKFQPPLANVKVNLTLLGHKELIFDLFKQKTLVSGVLRVKH